MSENKLFRAIGLPIALLIIAYIGYVTVDALIKATPGFADSGWYIYTALISAIVFIIGYNWYDLIRSNL